MEEEKENTVLVTGGRGFIGRAVRKLLHSESYSVLSLDQPASATDHATNSGVAPETLIDIADGEQLRSLFQARAIGRIIHLAAVLPTAAQHEPVRGTQVNIDGSLNLLEMAREFGVRRFVFGSSLSVYGTCGADQFVSEGYRTAPEDLYGAAKLYVEQLGEAYRHSHGLEFASLRIGRVVGAGARSATSAWRSEIFECLGTASAAEIQIPYADSERILLVHVEDVARMIVSLLQAPRLAHTAYNAACESVIVGELKSIVERLNPNVRVKLGGQAVIGNPQRVDWSRFEGEFGFMAAPVFEQLAGAAKHQG